MVIFAYDDTLPRIVLLGWNTEARVPKGRRGYEHCSQATALFWRPWFPVLTYVVDVVSVRTWPHGSLMGVSLSLAGPSVDAGVYVAASRPARGGAHRAIRVNGDAQPVFGGRRASPRVCFVCLMR